MIGLGVSGDDDDADDDGDDDDDDEMARRSNAGERPQRACCPSPSFSASPIATTRFFKFLSQKQ